MDMWVCPSSTRKAGNDLSFGAKRLHTVGLSEDLKVFHLDLIPVVLRECFQQIFICENFNSIEAWKLDYPTFFCCRNEVLKSFAPRPVTSWIRTELK